MTAKEHEQAAKDAIAEYHEIYRLGGEIDYPHWADSVLSNTSFDKTAVERMFD